MSAPREGCKTTGRHFPTNPNFQPRDCVDLAPCRGAIRFIVRSGGLRGLRPPATFFATRRVAVRSVNYINTLAKSGKRKRKALTRWVVGSTWSDKELSLKDLKGASSHSHRGFS